MKFRNNPFLRMLNLTALLGAPASVPEIRHPGDQEGNHPRIRQTKRASSGARGRPAMAQSVKRPGVIRSGKVSMTRAEQLDETARQAKLKKRRIASLRKGRNGKLLGLRPDLA